VSTSIPLTVIVGTTQPWPEIAVCLDSIHAQALALGAEVLAIDGHGEGLPADLAARYPGVTPIRAAGASIFQLRAEAMRRARGEVVAVTEDHCRAAPDWCERIVAAHREWPQAAVVGGVVENGAAARLLDWAHFFVTNGAAMPPIRRGARRRVALQATVSYKRRVLPREHPPWGYMEWMLNEELHQRGEQLVADDRIAVQHVQSFSLRDTLAIHYHDARCIAAFRTRRIAFGEWLLRLGVAGTVMAPLLCLRTLVAVAPKGRLGLLAAGAPWIAVIAACRAAGSVVGFVAGEGQSPLRIR
jgi:hypothetical protein